jgi:tetratricopeptide (TPR) repeat protein
MRPGTPLRPARRRRAGGALLAVLALALAGCGARGPLLAPQLPQGAASPALELVATPFFPQEKYQCGPAALATVLGASGTPVDPEALTPKVYLPGRRGSLQAELAAAARRYGRLPYEIPPALDALLAELRDGRPVLVLLNLGIGIAPVWHYAVAVGYLPATDELVLRSGTTRRKAIAARRFDQSWERADRWGFVVLLPGELPASAEPRRYLEAAAALESAGATDAAARAYAAAVERWPDNPAARFGLGNAYYAQGKREEAERAFRAVIERSASFLPAYNNLAMVLAERGCRTEALAVIERGLEQAAPSGAMVDALSATRTEIEAAPAAECGASTEGQRGRQLPPQGLGGRTPRRAGRGLRHRPVCLGGDVQPLPRSGAHRRGARPGLARDRDHRPLGAAVWFAASHRLPPRRASVETSRSVPFLFPICALCSSEAFRLNLQVQMTDHPTEQRKVIPLFVIREVRSHFFRDLEVLQTVIVVITHPVVQGCQEPEPSLRQLDASRLAPPRDVILSPEPDRIARRGYLTLEICVLRDSLRRHFRLNHDAAQKHCFVLGHFDHEVVVGMSVPGVMQLDRHARDAQCFVPAQTHVRDDILCLFAVILACHRVDPELTFARLDALDHPLVRIDLRAGILLLDSLVAQPVQAMDMSIEYRDDGLVGDGCDALQQQSSDLKTAARIDNDHA